MSTTVDFWLIHWQYAMVLQHKLQINSPDVNAFELYLHHWPLNYRRLYNIWIFISFQKRNIVYFARRSPMFFFIFGDHRQPSAKHDSPNFQITSDLYHKAIETPMPTFALQCPLLDLSCQPLARYRSTRAVGKSTSACSPESLQNHLHDDDDDVAHVETKYSLQLPRTRFSKLAKRKCGYWRILDCC